jgi:hypothetical protein
MKLRPQPLFQQGQKIYNSLFFFKNLCISHVGMTEVVRGLGIIKDLNWLLLVGVACLFLHEVTCLVICQQSNSCHKQHDIMLQHHSITNIMKERENKPAIKMINSVKCKALHMHVIILKIPE